MVHKLYSFCSGSGWLLLSVPHAVWLAETLCTLLPTKDSKELLNCYSQKILYFIVQRSKALYLLPAGSDWLFPRPFLLLMCLCSYFAHVTCSFFPVAFIVYCAVYGMTFRERNSSVSRVTSLDLVKSVSTASKGLINNYWGGWVEAETWCFRRSGVYQFENHVAGLIHNCIVPWNGNLHKSWLPLAYVKPCSPSRRRKNLLRRFSFFLEEGTDTLRLRDHLYQWLSWARQTRRTYIFQKQQHVIISRKTATRRITKATATKMIIVSRSSSMMINKINKWFDSMNRY